MKDNYVTIFVFSGSDSIFARREKGSRKLEERFSKKNKNVRICIKTRKVSIPCFSTEKFTYSVFILVNMTLIIEENYRI